MPTLINFKGYTSKDPLDKAPVSMQYIIVMSVNLILSVILIYFITKYNVVQFNGFRLFGYDFPPLATMILEVITNTFIYSFLIVLLRKSSSLIIYLIVFLPYYLLDLYLESFVRHSGGTALWVYGDPSLVSGIQIPALKFFITISVDALVFGILALFVGRVMAMIIYGKKDYPQAPTDEQYQKLFSDKWSKESVPKPKRDASYWILRLLGFGYVVYLSILLAGILGAAPWPEGIAGLINMTYENPALAINTYFKIILMTMLAFLGAYNKNLRFHSALGLIVGHAVSTVYSLAMYFIDKTNPYSEFLLTSAIVDGVMIILFTWIMLKHKTDSEEFNPKNDLPIYFSIPATLLKSLYKIIAIVFLVISASILLLRFLCDGETGIAAVFGYPDPMIGNTITLYLTLSLLAFLLIKRDKLRNHFFGLILFPLAAGSIVSSLWIITGNIVLSVEIMTRNGTAISVDWYFILYALINLIIAALMIAVRKMYYNVDYAISSLNPSTAKNILALTNTFFKSDSKHQSEVLQSIDQYMGGMRGRKRGLLNLPFALLESVFNWLMGLHPAFSSMSRDEQRYFLRKYIFTDELERKKSLVPDVSNFLYQIGLSLNSMIMFAHFSQLNERSKIGYVPADARDRLQGDSPSYEPPFRSVAKLPVDEEDSANFKPPVSNDYKLVAPRVTTPYDLPGIPDEIDYVIIGSGAGGATAAYKLACGISDPSQILVVERGHRYQPLQDFNDSEIDMMKKIYKEGGLQQTKKFTMSVLQGECVGGTTVSNNAVCFKMPDKIRKYWEDEFGLSYPDLDSEYEKIAVELDIKPLGDSGINTIVKSKFQKGVDEYNKVLSQDEKLNYHGAVSVNHLNNVGDGNWNLGNKRMRKRSMLETYIPWSEARGVKYVSNITAVQFVASSNGNRAEYVVLRTDSGNLQRVKIRKALIVTGGVIASSHFLMRSGVKNGNIGKNMSCNFAFPLTFEYEDRLNAFDGDQITLAAIDSQSRAIFETYFNPPAAFSLASVPFFFDRRDSIMSRYKYLINYGALIGSEPNGTINRQADLLNGQAFSWDLGEKDLTNIKYALTSLIKLGLYSGSKKVVLPMKPGIELNLSDKNEVDLFLKTLTDFPLRIEDIYLNTAHPQGGNIMTSANSKLHNKRVTNENFKLDGFTNVYIADASIFPSSLTVNPQWTIMAMSALAVKNVLHAHN
ncbi:MAG: GMC family oxidoreductase N-terminal domain-containing protein [Ignavibacteriales bacterium]|nr:MAG: GMC family oxidoreductase N-terminal domain-containing protein [Ignavibacteriales bacterium]